MLHLPAGHVLVERVDEHERGGEEEHQEHGVPHADSLAVADGAGQEHDEHDGDGLGEEGPLEVSCVDEAHEDGHAEGVVEGGGGEQGGHGGTEGDIGGLGSESWKRTKESIKWLECMTNTNDIMSANMCDGRVMGV